MRRFLVLALGVGLLLGCSHGEESDCSKYVTQLHGQNPAAVFEQISELKCQGAMEAFTDTLWTANEGQYRKDILRVASEIWEPSAKQFEREAARFKEIKSDYNQLIILGLQDPETAPIAASLVGEWKVRAPEIKKQMVKILEDDLSSALPQYEQAYARIVNALVGKEQLNAANEVPASVLIKLLTRSPETQGVDVNQIAAEALADVDSENRDAAIQALIQGLFIADGKVLKESVHSLLSIGTPAVPFLLAIINSKTGDEAVRYMEEFAVTNGLQGWKWRDGIWIRMLLAQLRDERSAEALIKDIAKPVIPPAGMPKELRQEWEIVRNNRIKFDSWGLMSVMHPGVEDLAVNVMRDREVEGSARLQLALAMAFNQTQTSANALFRVIYQVENQDVDDEEMGVVAGAKADIDPPARESDFVIRFLQPLIYGMSYKDLDRFNDLFVEGFDEFFGDQDHPEHITDKIEEVDVQVLLKTLEACKEDLDCYTRVAQGTIPREILDPDKMREKYGTQADQRFLDFIGAMARTKAVLVISTWKFKKAEDRKAALDIISAVYRTLPYNDGLYGDLRRVLMLAFERLGRMNQKSTLAELQILLKQGRDMEEKKEADGVGAWNQRLEALVMFLGNYDAKETKERIKALSSEKEDAVKKGVEAPKDEKKDEKKEEAK